METNPTVVDGLGIIPLFSWYHEVIVVQLSRVSLFYRKLVVLNLVHHAYLSNNALLLPEL